MILIIMIGLIVKLTTTQLRSYQAILCLFFDGVYS